MPIGGSLCRKEALFDRRGQEALCAKRRPSVPGGGPACREEALYTEKGPLSREEALYTERRPSVPIGGPLYREEALCGGRRPPVLYREEALCADRRPFVQIGGCARRRPFVPIGGLLGGRRSSIGGHLNRRPRGAPLYREETQGILSTIDRCPRSNLEPLRCPAATTKALASIDPREQ